MEFYLVLIGIVALFFVLLLVKEISRQERSFCVICASIFISWVVLLVLNFLEIFQDKILLGILMGHTSLGIFYMIESKSKNELKVFRLPLLLTLVSVIYFALSGIVLNAVYVLGSLWILFLVVYFFRNSRAKLFVNKLIECCRNW